MPDRLLSRIWRSRNAYFFICPFYLSFLVFSAFPILFSFYLSFRRWDGFGESVYAGLANYRLLLLDERFHQAIWNTIYMWLGHIFIAIVAAFLLAATLNIKDLPGKGLFRVAFYLPNVTGVVPMALAFTLLLDQQYGLVNYVLTHLGLPAIPWLTNIHWAKNAIIIFIFWRGLGWLMVVYLAGLQSIDPDLFEAALVDGAGPLARLRHITLPSLMPLIGFTFITSTIGSFRMFTEPQILTQGGPAGYSTTINQYLYQTAFAQSQMGYAAAISYALFAMIVLVSAAQYRLLRRQVEGY